jgi:gamma-glutamyl-gamma-aminobutyrate hydrolase PuuD
MTAVQPITLAEVMPADVTTHADAPLVGVVVPLNYPDLSDETRELVVRFTRTALNTLTDLGARLLIIDPTSDASFDDEVDGLVLLGGGDVDPGLYGYLGGVPNLYGVDRRCDLRTLASINRALDEQIPVLGICPARGVDGVIEAIEHCDPQTWVLGVQWHPEDTDGPAADREALFRAFLVRVDIDRRAVGGRVYIDASMRRPADGLT